MLARGDVDGVLLRREQVDEQGPEPRVVQSVSDAPVAGAMAAAPAAVGEEHDAASARRDGEPAAERTSLHPDGELVLDRARGGLVEQRAHLLVGRLREVLVPEAYRVEGLRRPQADDLVNLPRQLLARRGRRDRNGDDDAGRAGG